MKIKDFVIGLLLVVGVFMVGRWTAPVPEPIKEEVVVQDTTVIDSLKQELQYWRELEPDTVTQQIEVPVPVEAEGLNIYNVPYSDSTLSANIGLTVEGILDEVKFEYYLKRELVTETTRTIYETRYVDRTRTITIPERPEERLSFNHSIEAGYRMYSDFDSGPYVQYRPEFSVIGIDLVGTAHLSQDSYFAIGIKKEF